MLPPPFYATCPLFLLSDSSATHHTCLLLFPLFLYPNSLVFDFVHSCVSFFHHFLSIAPCPSTRDGRCFNVLRRPPSFGWRSVHSNSQLRTTSTLVAKHKTHLLPRQSQSFHKRQTRLPDRSNLVSLTSGSSRPSPSKLLLQRTSLPFALEMGEDVFAGSNHGVVAIVG